MVSRCFRRSLAHTLTNCSSTLAEFVVADDSGEALKAKCVVCPGGTVVPSHKNALDRHRCGRKHRGSKQWQQEHQAYLVRVQQRAGDSAANEQNAEGDHVNSFPASLAMESSPAGIDELVDPIALAWEHVQPKMEQLAAVVDLDEGVFVEFAKIYPVDEPQSPDSTHRSVTCDAQSPTRRSSAARYAPYTRMMRALMKVLDRVKEEVESLKRMHRILRTRSRPCATNRQRMRL